VLRRAVAALAAVHLLLTVAVSCRGTAWLVSRELTLLPVPFAGPAKVLEDASAVILGRSLPDAHPVREVINSYLHLAGIQTGYGYFAPNVPDAYKLVFELYREDGEVDYQAAGVERGESSLRFASLLDFVGRTASDADRRFLVQLLAQSIWNERPDVVRVRAILATVTLPGPAEFRQSPEVNYEIRDVYDFKRPAAVPEQ
jgi:hypothetical protein